MVETIEIVMRKIEEWGSVSETVLVSLPSTSSPEIIQSPSVLTFPSLKIHIHEQTVYHNDTLIPLTHREFFTLTYLASHPLNRGYSGKGKTNKQKSSIHAGLWRDGSPKAEHQ